MIIKFPESEDEGGANPDLDEGKSELPEEARTQEQGSLKRIERGPGEEAEEAFISGEALSEADVRIMAEDLGKTQKEAAEMQEKYLRLAAEFDNYKKRIAKEQKEFVDRAKASFIVEILPVLDNLGRAEESTRSMGVSETIADGIKIVISQLKAILKKEGVEEITALGQKFDPARHEAVMVQEAKAGEDQLIIDEFQKGYIYKDKVLRPSKVKVAIHTPGDSKPQS